MRTTALNLLLVPCGSTPTSPLVTFAQSDNLFIIQNPVRSAVAPREMCPQSPATLSPSLRSSSLAVRPAPHEKSTEMLPPSTCQKGKSQKWFPLPCSDYTAFLICEMLQQGKGAEWGEPVSGVGVLDLWWVGSFPGASQNNLS